MKPIQRHIIQALPAASVATNDIHAIKPPVEIPSSWMGLLWLLLIVAVVMVALWWWRRRQKATKPVVPAVIIPPYRRAFERLNAALDLLHDPHRFIVVVSQTVRVYLEERFRLHAPERTTEEFLFEVRNSADLTDVQKNSLADFLSRCDMVKFARYEPPEAELREIYQAAVRLVEETKDAPPIAGSQDEPLNRESMNTVA